MRETLYSRVKSVVAIPPTTVTADGSTVGGDIDLDQTRQDFRIASLVVFAGDITDGTYVFAVEESPDGSSAWTAIPASRIQGSAISLTSSNAGSVREIGIVPNPGTARFLRATLEASGVTTGGTVGAIFLLGSPSHYPVVR